MCKHEEVFASYGGLQMMQSNWRCCGRATATVRASPLAAAGGGSVSEGDSAAELSSSCAALAAGARACTHAALGCRKAICSASLACIVASECNTLKGEMCRP